LGGKPLESWWKVRKKRGTLMKLAFEMFLPSWRILPVACTAGGKPIYLSKQSTVEGWALISMMIIDSNLEEALAHFCLFL
jgi:hypothetical protein